MVAHGVGGACSVETIVANTHKMAGVGRHRMTTVFFALLCNIVLLGVLILFPKALSGAAGTTLHFAPNSDFASGSYDPGAAGFNLADVASPGVLGELPPGVEALVYVGLCGGVDAGFMNAIAPFLGDPRVFGFYLMDEPDPTGLYKPICPASNLKAESDWIHANDPGVKTFITVMNMGSSSDPSYDNTYNPSNSDVDLFGLDPYPCRSELDGCDDSLITSAVAAAEESGIPQADIVPVFQAFGGGTFVDDDGGQYLLPTPAQEQAILSTWASAVPDPLFDYAYSWGSQNSDTALSSDPLLQAVFAAHNDGTGLQTTTTTVTENMTSVVYGAESAASFNVAITSGGAIPIPDGETATINVGPASCVAQLVSGGGSCSLTDTALAVGGPYPVSASYAGDSMHSGSTGVGGTFRVGAVPTTTQLALARSSVVYGDESQVLSVMVWSSFGSPTGSVFVSWSGGALCSTTLDQQAVSCDIGSTQMPGGTVTPITASYEGSAIFASSTSPEQWLTVAKDSTTATVTVSPTTVSRRSLSSAVFSVTVTTGNGEAVPNGEVATVSVRSETCRALLTQGRGSCELPNWSLSSGVYSAIVAYPGDSNLLSSRAWTATPLRVTK
jgi:hypothetical protein